MKFCCSADTDGADSYFVRNLEAARTFFILDVFVGLGALVCYLSDVLFRLKALNVAEIVTSSAHCKMFIPPIFTNFESPFPWGLSAKAKTIAF